MSDKYWMIAVVLLYCGGCTPHTEEAPAATASAPAATPAASAAPMTAAPTSPPMPDPAAAAAAPAPSAVTAAPPAAPGTSAAPGAAPATAPFTPLPPPGLPTAAPATAGTGTPPPAVAATEQVTAQAGEGLKGQSLKNESGYFVEAAKAYFNVQQRVVFEMEIPKAMQLYKALEGRAPQTHDEFMSKIISANQIKLPQLPAGNRYLYDPQREELMVEKPANR